MKINKNLLYPILFYKVLPNSYTTINFSPIALILMIFDTSFFLYETKRFSINLIIPIVLLSFFSFIQLFSHGFIVIKPLILLFCSIIGGLYLAFKISKFNPRFILAIYSFYYLFISLISLTESEASIFLPIKFPALNGLTGFGGLSTSLLFYFLPLILISFKNIFNRLLGSFILFLVFICSFNNTALLIFTASLLFFLIVMFLTLIRQVKYFCNSILNSKFSITFLFLVISIFFALVLYAVFNIFGSETIFYLDGLTSFRVTLANESLKSFFDSSLYNKLFGYGLGSGYLHLYQVSDVISSFWGYPKQIHNSFLSIFYDTGIVGSTFLFLALTYLLSNLYKNMQKLYLGRKLLGTFGLSKFLYYISLFCGLSIYIGFSSMDKYTDILSYTMLFAIPITIVNNSFDKDIN